MTINNLALAATFDASLLEMALTAPAMRDSFDIDGDFGEDPYLNDVMNRTAAHALNSSVQPLDDDTSAGIIRHVSAAGLVLLRNQKNVLPLSSSLIRTVAVIGPLTVNGMFRDIKMIAPEHLRLQNAPGCPPDNSFSDELLAAALSAAVRSDAVVLCLGTEDGMYLPAPQLALLEAVSMLGKPAIAAVFGTYPHALANIHKKMDSLILAWEHTRHSGAALGHILFGQVNPSGRLPVTLPRAPDETGTYLFARYDPLYPFGYGLSYTHFTYGDFKLSANRITAGQPVSAECVVENTGTLAGHETVQLYLRRESRSSADLPRWRLCGFQRIFLKKGESRAVRFELPPLSEISRYVVYAGGHQPDARSVWLTETPVLSAFLEVI
ncbi:MAG: glycoside hydrolase family 3 C-terminal domain-containing protein [Oscillospiraceae bacterium]|nr:glycoside hydrolase family 3 C-terminal domain-containing protein [Oscillospiraceae bacterium]